MEPEQTEPAQLLFMEMLVDVVLEAVAAVLRIGELVAFCLGLLCIGVVRLHVGLEVVELADFLLQVTQGSAAQE